MALDAEFTPVIFPLDRHMPFAPVNTSSGSSIPIGLSYMERLEQRHQALARIAREEPRFLPKADQHNNGILADEACTDALRRSIREALDKADGNPADGKYTFLTHLLRLNSTSGRNGRWSGVRTDLSPPEQLTGPGLGWINAKTDAEWKDWERKYEAERRVKDKVENWKKTVETPSRDHIGMENFPQRKAPGLSSARSKASSVKLAADPLKSASLFGFSVVKRAQKADVGKPSGSGSGKAKPPADQPSHSASKPHHKHIADLPEHSFIPPSFPASQLLTSTPKHAKPSSRARKPSPIPHINTAQPPSSEFSVVPEASQQPLSSPRVTKTYGRHNASPSQPLQTSSSLPAIPLPTTPTRNYRNSNRNDDNDSIFNTNNKRLLSSPATPDKNNNDDDNGERALKRARTLSEFLHSPGVPPPSNRRTPQQTLTGYMNRNLLTPTNLTRAVPTAASKAGSAAAEAAPSSPLSHLPSSSLSPKKAAAAAVPTLIDLLASAKKGKKKFPAAAGIAKPLSKGKDKGKGKERAKEARPLVEDDHIDVQEMQPVTPFLFPEAVVEEVEEAVAEKEKEAEEVESVHANFHDLSDKEKDPLAHPFDPYAAVLEPLPFDDPSLMPIDAMSPAKSLSSLAGSDSEDDDIEDDDDENAKSVGFSSFKPLATSTQRGPFPGAGMQESQPPHDLSQITKDSWESIYAPPSMPKSKSASSKLSVKSKSPSEPRHYQLPNLNPNPIPSSNPFIYNSQFATGVAKSVYDVDRILEQDVEYSGWIRDPYADDMEDADDGGLKEPESSP